jgi:xanthine dehydrogenase YagR molybdenum-binding subunit
MTRRTGDGGGNRRIIVKGATLAAGAAVEPTCSVPASAEVIFLDETGPMSSPMKATGVAELGICGVAAAIANAIYNATGIRGRDYPITLDKLLHKLAEVS